MVVEIEEIMAQTVQYSKDREIKHKIIVEKDAYRSILQESHSKIPVTDM